MGIIYDILVYWQRNYTARFPNHTKARQPLLFDSFSFKCSSYCISYSTGIILSTCKLNANCRRIFNKLETHFICSFQNELCSTMDFKYFSHVHHIRTDTFHPTFCCIFVISHMKIRNNVVTTAIWCWLQCSFIAHMSPSQCTWTRTKENKRGKYEKSTFWHMKPTYALWMCCVRILCIISHSSFVEHSILLRYHFKRQQYHMGIICQ